MHNHANYGYGKASSGDYFCLNCGDQIPSSIKMGDMKMKRHLCVAKDWPLGGKDCDHSDPY